MALNFLQVNFLAGKQAEYQKQQQRLLLIQGAAFALLVVYVIGLGSLFAYSFYLGRQQKSLDTQIKTLDNEIEELSPVEAKHVFIKTKLDALLPVLTSQRQNQALVEAIFTVISPGISVSGLTIQEDGKISFSGEAVEFAALAQFLTNLERGNLTPAVRLELAELGGVSLRSDGAYSFNVTLNLTTTETSAVAK